MYQKIISLFLMSFCVFANVNTDVVQLNREAKSQIETNRQQVNHMDQMSQHQLDQNLSLVNSFLSKARSSEPQNRHGGQPADGAMLFISTSMPKSLIIQMTEQASYYHIPVVIRGLIDNDMKKTLQAILDIKTTANKHHQPFTGISIDPVWFEQFNITAVPAFVISKRPANCQTQHTCSNEKYDVIYGNQSIKDSIQEIATDGSIEIKPIAQSLLNY